MIGGLLTLLGNLILIVVIGVALISAAFIFFVRRAMRRGMGQDAPSRYGAPRPGVRVRVVDAARLRVGATSQSGKAGAQRTVGRMGSMRALAVPGPGVRVVAVDDVVTTGATVREMERVLGGLDAVVTLCRPGLIS